MIRPMPPTLAPALLTVLLAGCIQTTLEPDPDGGPVDAMVADAAPDGGVAPLLELDPPAIVLAGEGDVAEVTLRNVGQTPLVIHRIRREGNTGFAALHAGLNALTLSQRELSGDDGLAPGDSIVLTIEALTGPPAEATLVIESDDPDRPVAEVPIGFPGAPCLQPGPPTLMALAALGDRSEARVALQNCGTEPLDITRVHLTDDTDGAFELAADVPRLPATVPPGGFVEAGVVFTPRIDGPVRGELIVEATGIRLTIPVTGRVRQPACPVALPVEDSYAVSPETVVVLDGSTSVDPDGPNGQPVSWTWTVVARPDGSTSMPVESLDDPARAGRGGPQDDPSTPIALFFVDRPGEYRVILEVADAHGCTSEALVVLRAGPMGGIMLQLTWAPVDGEVEPGRGADLDLHLLHPTAPNWFDDELDCYFRNPGPDWGRPGDTTDDPALAVDAVGTGPELLELAEPEDTAMFGAPYIVGVHHYGWRGEGVEPAPVRAELRVFVEGEQIVQLQRQLDRQEQLWDAVQIDWPSGEVTVRDRLYDGRP